MTNLPVPARQLCLTPITSDGDPTGPTVRFPADWPSAVPVIDLTEASLDDAIDRWREWVTSDQPDLVVDALVLHKVDARIVVVEGREFRATLSERPTVQTGQLDGQHRASDPYFNTSLPQPTCECGLDLTRYAGPGDERGWTCTACDTYEDPWFDDHVYDYLARQEIDPAAFVARWYPDGRWGGDRCGCVDDRCAGYHHAVTEPCGCFEQWVDDFMANTPVREWNVTDQVTRGSLDREPSPVQGVIGLSDSGESGVGQPSGSTVPSGTPGQRRAVAGELCSCGRQAIVIYETEQFGDVPYCGIPDSPTI